MLCFRGSRRHPSCSHPPTGMQSHGPVVGRVTLAHAVFSTFSWWGALSLLFSISLSLAYVPPPPPSFTFWRVYTV